MEKTKIRIGLVDDHALMRAGLSQVLGQFEGIEIVLEASNGKELLDLLPKTKVDIILLDLQMPVMSGHEALPVIVEKYPHIKVLVLSMHDTNSFIVNMMEGGASGYLLKDTPPKTVYEAIHTVMEDGLYFNSKVSRALLASLPGSKLKIKSNTNFTETLTSRELEILRLICQELTTNQIGEKLFLSPKTIEGYRKQLLEKTGSKNAAGLAIFAVRNNLY